MKKIKIDTGAVLGGLGLLLTIGSYIVGIKQGAHAQNQLKKEITADVLKQVNNQK